MKIESFLRNQGLATLTMTDKLIDEVKTSECKYIVRQVYDEDAQTVKLQFLNLSLNCGSGEVPQDIKERMKKVLDALLLNF